MADLTQTQSATVVLTNLTNQQFKQTIGCESFQVVKNPKNDKLFVSTSNGKTFRAQQSLDVTKPISWLIPDGNIEDACLINASEQNVVATF